MRDVLHYLVRAADLPPEVNRTFDIGGPEVLTYREMIQRFAKVAGLMSRRIVTVPVLTPYLASQWVGFVTPVPTGVAKPLVGSLLHEVVCAEHDLDDLVGPPPGGPLSFDRAVADAIAGDDVRPPPGTGHRRPRARHERRPRVGRRSRERRVVSRSRPMNPVTELRAFVRAALVDPVPATTPSRTRRSTAVGSSRPSPCSSAPWYWPGRCASSPVTRRSTSRPSPWPRCGPAVPSCPARCTSVAATPAAATSPAGPSCSRSPSGPCCSGCSWPVRSSSRRSRSCATRSRSCSTTPGSAPSPLVTVITIVNGIAEELYFRGALYAAVGRRHAVAVTTIVYTLVTATSGIPLLVLAAALVGLVVAFQRRVTGGILGPAITHLTWSLGMLFLLPPVLDRLS